MRRMSLAWLFLLAIELFCPVFCDEPAFAAELKSPQPSEINFVIGKEDKPLYSALSLDALENADDSEAFCNDECLCHATAIPSLNGITVRKLYFRSETINTSYGKPVFNSLPPPFQPPKNS